jgi:hypothetical protein
MTEFNTNYPFISGEDLTDENIARYAADEYHVYVHFWPVKLLVKSYQGGHFSQFGGVGRLLAGRLKSALGHGNL